MTTSIHLYLYNQDSHYERATGQPNDAKDDSEEKC